VVHLGPLAAPAAARLFRMRAAARGVVLSDDQRAQVDSVVQAVDGLPLALELSASRVGLLGIDGLLERLRDPLALLRANRPDLPERHRSIRAALELSWAALDAAERAFLAGCCVFRSPFRIEDAEVVVSPGGSADALDLAQAVVDASLVRVVEDGSGVRRLAPYMAVRELALEQGDPAWIRAVRGRHLAWLAGLSAGLGVGEEPGPASYPRLAPLLEDGIQAIRYGLDQGRPGDAARVATWLAPVMARRGAGLRAAELLDSLGDPAALDIDLELAVRLLRALLKERGTRPDAAPALFEAVADRARDVGRHHAEAAALLAWADASIDRNVGARPLLARARAVLARDATPLHAALLGGLEGRARFFDGDAEGAGQSVIEALDVLRSLGRGWEASRMLHSLAEIRFHQHRYDEAESFVREELAIHEPAQVTDTIDGARALLGRIRQGQGRLPEALEIFRDARERARRVGDAQREQRLCNSMGGVLGMMGRTEEAVAAYEDSLRLAREQRTPVQVSWALTRLAAAAWRLGHMDAARSRLGEAIAGFGAAGRPIYMAAARIELGQVELLCGDLAAAEAVLAEAQVGVDTGTWEELARAMWGEARARGGDAAAIAGLRHAVEVLKASWPTEGHARGLVSLGMACLALGERGEAEAALAEAEAIRAATGDTDGNIARNVRRLREALA
jgi:tetratricopeptide (TPR) repeat protein